MAGGYGFSCVTQGVSTSGTLAQIIALGAADTNLTACPSKTWWRLRVTKCTNFAMESIIQAFSGAAMWGSQVQVTLNRSGDLLHWMYALLDIPGIAAMQIGSGGTLRCSGSMFPYASVCNPCDDPKEIGDCDAFGDPLGDDDDEDYDDDLDNCSGLRKPYANWVNAIGFAAVSRAAYSIGSQVIECLYGHFMFMWEELAGQPGKRLEEMIGRSFTRAQLVQDSMRARRLYVPLPFNFTRTTGNSLPLVSLQFHSFQVHICLAPLSKLIQVSDCDVMVLICENNTAISAQDVRLYLDTTYVYLDMEERDRFAVASFQQLITQVQQMTCCSSSPTISAQLDFNHPAREMIWAVQRKCQADANNTFDYSGAYGRDPIENARLAINSNTRFDREAAYFRLVQPWQHHTNIPRGFIYLYSFDVCPESAEPGGSLNFSRIDNTSFEAVVQAEIAGTPVMLLMFVRSWNVVRYRQGLGGILFSNKPAWKELEAIPWC